MNEDRDDLMRARGGARIMTFLDSLAGHIIAGLFVACMLKYLVG